MLQTHRYTFGHSLRNGAQSEIKYGAWFDVCQAMHLVSHDNDMSRDVGRQLPKLLHIELLTVRVDWLSGSTSGELIHVLLLQILYLTREVIVGTPLSMYTYYPLWSPCEDISPVCLWNIGVMRPVCLRNIGVMRPVCLRS